ncbi:MAG: glutamine--tRNA ligase/YqeY domain fusion protein [Saprospiraceae bacterium]|nr:glutamine--tRNA ligase/YqeY domain fusion protein [Saprospiraceae bacterium]
MSEPTTESLNFIEEIVEDWMGKNPGEHIITRFPPEPNGYLHIGHASSICLNFGLTNKYGGYTNLRFDDTNPTTEETEYVESIKNDIKWLGFDWKNEYYASDYFNNLYEFAKILIQKGLAYVDDSSSETIAQLKGTPTKPGENSPFRERAIAENLDLFERMKLGEFPDGTRVLRAKIDMSNPNMIMRDPILYRIKKAHHHRTGDDWCIYPMYDFAHGQSDSIEKITHSICTMEFIPHRELYDWCIENLEIFPSKQYEFARRNLNYTITSKRKLLQLVNEGHVSGWDDPRMPTISGMRRRGYTAAAIRNFCDKIGIAKRDNIVDMALLEFCVREDLNKSTDRLMAVLDPIKVVITNYPEGKTEQLAIENNPEDENSGSRAIPFSNTLYIESEDFMEEAPKKYFRLTLGGYVRLKGAYIIKCDEIVKKSDGSIDYLKCSYAENSKSGQDTSGIAVKGTIHWVSVPHAVQAEVRLYDRLLSVPDPSEFPEQDFKDFINPNSLVTLKNVPVEPAMANIQPGTVVQFMRKGYFCCDLDTKDGQLVFNRTATLKGDMPKF